MIRLKRTLIIIKTIIIILVIRLMKKISIKIKKTISK